MALGSMNRRRKEFSAPKLNVTSMMDMFTIILIFLLFSFSSEQEPAIYKDVKLPESSTKKTFRENLKLTLSQEGVMVEGKMVSAIKNGKIAGLKPGRLKESALYRQLILEKKKRLLTDKNNQNYILFICDKLIPFKTINNVIKTAAMAGYPNIKITVLKK